MEASQSAISLPDLIPVRMLSQFAYCNRLSYMEWVHGEFETNEYVADGKYQHRRVDKPAGMKKLQEDDESIHARTVMLSDATLGLISKLDVLEIEGETATPVEYKRGKVPDTPEKAYLDHIIQVCAQGLLLRANGYQCDSGLIYYIQSKQRVEVKLDDRNVAMTLQMIYDMKEMAKGGIPPPLENSPKCPKCSLVGICLPDETNMLSEKRNTEVRRMYPIRSDSRPVYVQKQGAYVSLSGGTIRAKFSDKEIEKIRLIDMSELVVFGNVQITTQAIREMCNSNIPICYMSYRGWFQGMTWGASHKNIELRIMQHKTFGEKSKTLKIANEMVYGKIKNSMTMLRRNNKNIGRDTLEKIEELAKRARATRKYDVLLGLEGAAAKIYFENFAGMLKSDLGTFDFVERNRRPPKDPVNAMLSFLYSMLARQATATIARTGLDPYLGYLHRPKYGKPALALDIMEEFRPLVADSTCIKMINNKMIEEADMVQTSFGTSLTDDGRRKVIQAYEQRMDTSVHHNTLGYAASYKRILETQARILGRHLLGEIPSYVAFRTR